MLHSELMQPAQIHRWTPPNPNAHSPRPHRNNKCYEGYLELQYSNSDSWRGIEGDRKWGDRESKAEKSAGVCPGEIIGLGCSLRCEMGVRESWRPRVSASKGVWDVGKDVRRWSPCVNEGVDDEDKTVIRTVDCRLSRESKSRSILVDLDWRLTGPSASVWDVVQEEVCMWGNTRGDRDQEALGRLCAWPMIWAQHTLKQQNSPITSHILLTYAASADFDVAKINFEQSGYRPPQLQGQKRCENLGNSVQTGIDQKCRWQSRGYFRDKSIYPMNLWRLGFQVAGIVA